MQRPRKAANNIEATSANCRPLEKRQSRYSMRTDKIWPRSASEIAFQRFSSFLIVHQGRTWARHGVEPKKLRPDRESPD